jgi:wyosine [tRNA(Phe)-imidazoG37] synthetase (radical SAM superfamily)
MSTFLFDKTIFGPVKSRRLGISLGINLLPNTRKYCNFNCIYCECGWNPEDKKVEGLPSFQMVGQLLESRLKEMKNLNQPLDAITFAGNGEPTMHPEFSQIIDSTLQIRNKYFPGVKVAVLSNSSMVFKPEIFDALNKVDLNILKLDSAFEETCRVLNNPVGYFKLDELVQNLVKFKGKLIIQTMFVKGCNNGVNFDNSSDAEVAAWLELIKLIKPLHVMIYTIARDTPVSDLQKVNGTRLKEIASKVKKIGFTVSISE